MTIGPPPKFHETRDILAGLSLDVLREPVHRSDGPVVLLGGAARPLHHHRSLKVIHSHTGSATL
jgi:hypothetical protein